MHQLQLIRQVGYCKQNYWDPTTQTWTLGIENSIDVENATDVEQDIDLIVLGADIESFLTKDIPDLLPLATTSPIAERLKHVNVPDLQMYGRWKDLN